jgi:hypothetical protein
MERLKERSENEGLSLAELVIPSCSQTYKLFLTREATQAKTRLSIRLQLHMRRAVDAFLAWDDPTYIPQPITPHKERGSHWP